MVEMITYSIIQKSQLEGALRIDAEYYQPEYLKIIQNLNKLKAIPIDEVAINPKRKFKPQENVPFRYIEISEIDLSTGEFVVSEITGENAPDRAQWIVEKDDVIVSTVRPIRNAVALIGGDSKDLVCSSGFAVLEPRKVDPEYLFVYLKSKPIVKLLDRLTTATMYPAVTTDDILNTRIYLGNENFRQEIKDKVIEAQKKLDQSKSLYFQSENLLLQELGLSDFKIEEDLSFIVNLSEIKDANRIDAEYFQPKYKKIIGKVEKHKLELLGNLVSMKKGFEPGSEEYQDEGKLFIRVSNISRFGFTDKDQKYLSNELYQDLKDSFEPKIGEILLTKDATPGIAYVLEEKIEGIIASGIMRLKIKEDIEAGYLALCINSIVGQMQIQRDAGGSIISHWKPEQIKNLQIPILPKSIQQKIADLVCKSHEIRKKAKELLNEAKRKVEELIEKT